MKKFKIDEDENKLKDKSASWFTIYHGAIGKSEIVNLNGERISGTSLLKNIREKIQVFKKCGMVKKSLALVMDDDVEWFVVVLALLDLENDMIIISSSEQPSDIQIKIKRLDDIPIFTTTAIKQQLKKKSEKDKIFAIDSIANGKIDCTKLPNHNFCGLGIFSSGTTGKSKVIYLSADSILKVVKIYINELIEGNFHTIISILPLSAIYPITIGLAVLFTGNRLIMANPRRSNLTDIMKKEKVEVIPAVPIFVENVEKNIQASINQKNILTKGFIKLIIQLSWFCRRWLGINLGKGLFAEVHQKLGNHLQVILCGGARLSKRTLKNMYAFGFTIYEGYGLTECGGIVSVRKNDFKGLGSVGQALPDIKIRICNPKDGLGEIAISTKRIDEGHQSQEWFNTGDIGYLDNDERLWITGRLKEIIVLANENKVHPSKIEQFYKSIEDIGEIAIAGIPDGSKSGDNIILFIESNSELPDSKLIDKINSVKIPTLYKVNTICTIANIPKNALGKVKRFELLQHLENNPTRVICLP